MVAQRASQRIRDVTSHTSQNTECYSYNPGDDNLNDQYKLYVNKTANVVVVTQFKTTNGHFNPLALEMDIYSLAHHLCTM